MHPVGGAADINVDFVIVKFLADFRCHGHAFGLRAAELQGEVMLRLGKAQQALPVAVNDRLRGDHFRIQQGPPADLTQEIAFMTVGIFHHRRDGKPPVYDVPRHYPSKADFKALAAWSSATSASSTMPPMRAKPCTMPA